MLKKTTVSHQTPKEIATEMDKYIIGQQDAMSISSGRRMQRSQWLLHLSIEVEE